MTQEYIEIPNKKWGIIFICNYDINDEYVELMATMRSFGLSQEKARKALSILSNYNTGMTLSIEDLRMSVVFVSETTSESEFWDTAIHEIKHVADHIIAYYDVKWDSEDAAYLTGFLTKQLVELIGEPCRN